MLRGRIFSKGLLRPPRHEEEEQEFVRPTRTSSPIYARDPTRNWSSSSNPDPIKSSADRLQSIMMDRKYHSTEELGEKLPGGEWAKAMRALLTRGMAFDRHGHYFRIRLLGIGEDPQSAAVLFDGIGLQPSKTLSPVKRRLSEDLLLDGEGDLVEANGWKPVDEEIKDGLVLSDPPEDLQLAPIPSAGMTGAILAMKKSGKTYLGMVLAEELMSTKALVVQVVVIDPTGVWHGLLATSEGNPSSFSLLMMGGDYADIPITAKDGFKAAEVVHAIYPVSVVADLSGLSPVEQHEFVADFSERLYILSKSRPIHIIFDEADEFAPQRSSGGPHQKRSLAALDRLVRRARVKGIGTTVITQRSAVISKNLISQVDALWLLNMVEHNDLVNVGTWLVKRVTPERRDECMSGVPNLLPGTAYFLQGGAPPLFRRFKVRRKHTYDSSRTPDGTARGKFHRSHPPADALAVAKKVFAESSLSSGGDQSRSGEGDDS